MVRETAFDEVFDSQVTFRALLEALSRPGTTADLPALLYRTLPKGLCAHVVSILKTLCDHRVSFSVGSADRRPDWVSYLEVNLASPFRPVAEAHYVVFEGHTFDRDFALLNRGSLEFPEAGATALLRVRRLSAETDREPPGAILRVAGPGVQGAAHLIVADLDPLYLQERRNANRFYPMGVDLFLVDDSGKVAGIPRTSAVEIG